MVLFTVQTLALVNMLAGACAIRRSAACVGCGITSKGKAIRLARRPACRVWLRKTAMTIPSVLVVP